MIPLAIPVILAAKAAATKIAAAAAAGLITGTAIGAGVTHAKAKKEMERIREEVKRKLGH